VIVSIALWSDSLYGTGCEVTLQTAGEEGSQTVYRGQKVWCVWGKPDCDGVSDCGGKSQTVVGKVSRVQTVWELLWGGGGGRRERESQTVGQ
jgi:hypothetical protein